MRSDMLTYIRSNKDYVQFIHEQPVWYRTLSRRPDLLEQFEIASINHLQKTIPHLVQKFENNVQMANMMMNMFYMFNQSSE